MEKIHYGFSIGKLAMPKGSLLEFEFTGQKRGSIQNSRPEDSPLSSLLLFESAPKQAVAGRLTSVSRKPKIPIDPTGSYVTCQRFPTDASHLRCHALEMTTARSLLVDSASHGYYRCISRCGRRAWLCGIDPYDGKSYEHRREWVEGRLLELADIFAVGIYAYAVMSNHAHVVLRIDPEAAAVWSPEDVASRWIRLFPATVDGEVDPIACQTKEQNLLGNAERLEICRQRLSSLAWFMRSLNEPIARRANHEDACTGRFWGRFLHPAKPAFLTSM